MRYPMPMAALACALLAACAQDAAPPAPAPAPAPTPAPAPAEPAAAPQAPSGHSFQPGINAEDFLAYTSVLASDEFAGRAPGTRGETLTIEYLRDQFQAMGLKPGHGDSWYQKVPMVETLTQPAAATVSIAGTDLEWAFGSQWVGGTRSEREHIEIKDSELVFVGYGVVAPEADWNDYAGLDVKGKTVVILINDPGFHAGDENLFGGQHMTYYGRWTYKFEEAARQGAQAALIIHDTPGAGYGWNVVETGWSGAQYDLPISNDPEPRLPAQGWITGEAAEDLFKRAGLSLQVLRDLAGKPGFKPVSLKGRLSVTLQSTIKHAESNNVLALIPGSERPDEAVIYMAHWDHLGTQTDADGNTRIYNGAIDNASGVAGIMEIAAAFAAGEPPKRSVLFMPVTLEESGLLGSRWYVNNPTFAMRNIAGVINLDAMTIVGRTRDIVVTGYGASELEDILRPIAERQGRVLHGETAVEKGFFFRSDHFNFVKAGVPSLYAKSGLDHVEKGESHGAAIADEYGANRYHKPEDVVDPNWDVSGVIEDLEAFYAVGRVLADGDSWPNWYPDSPFRAVRDADRAKAGAGAETQVK